ncbi:Hypothetical predicted protein [Paramuricea clavata]|uniref:Uncharacterized protein n=1 Tax=Paramuricea clavata TaxID=317549 RepID=A0A7D9DS11_PARCT|nr:Hypothetical predicted protein [Paramuricea clavata]
MWQKSLGSEDNETFRAGSVNSNVMATGHDLTNSVESQQIQLEYKLSEAYFTFKEFIECSNDGKVKWLSNLNDLKAFMSALFGDVGKWSSPGGSAKSYRNDLISINWYTHKKALIFHDRLGIVLKNKLIDLSVNKISDPDEYNQLNDPEVQAEFAIIKNQLGEVVQQVDRLVNTNENNNTNNNNIAESIVRTANENNSLINTIETLCKGLKTMIALCNANFINHSDQPSVSPISTLDQTNITPSATEPNQQQLHQILNPSAVCNFQDKSCIESFITVKEASITSEALSLDNTLLNSYPNVISISDDQQAGLSSPNGNSTTVEEIVTGINQNYNPSTMLPSFDDQLKEYRTKHSHTDRMIVVHNNSGITHQKPTRKSTRNRKTPDLVIKSKRCNYIPQPISHTDTSAYNPKIFRKNCSSNRPPDWGNYLILVNKLTQKTELSQSTRI